MLSDELTSENQVRSVVFYKRYFLDFYLSLNPAAQVKVESVLNLVQTLHRVPSKFLKHLSDTEGLYEIRVEYSSVHIRVFAIFGVANTVVVLNGFVKKTKKTSVRELRKAMKIKKEFYGDQS
jgi:phage-related protein